MRELRTKRSDRRATARDAGYSAPRSSSLTESEFHLVFKCLVEERLVIDETIALQAGKKQ